MILSPCAILYILTGGGIWTSFGRVRQGGPTVTVEGDHRPLYERIMGQSWTQIAEPVRCLHATHSIVRAHGVLRIEHAGGVVARLLARMLRLPRPSDAADTRLTVTARTGGEHWQRVFNGRHLATRQYECARGELAERFGILELRFRLDARDGSLLYIQREATLLVASFRVRIPVAWAPRVTAREDPAGPNQIKVAVRVTLPVIGPLIAYDGIIQVEKTHP
jgi:hypothetical protein